MSKQKSAGRWRLFAILAVCASPLLGSYLAYYVIKPGGRTNYGAILDPRRYPIPDLQSAPVDGKSFDLNSYKGKWVMLHADSATCDARCKTKLLDMRQLRLMQGKEMTRIVRVWLVTDTAPLDTALLREYEGTRIVRVKAGALENWLPHDVGTRLSDHIYMIDPLGNLMMRFPKDADPSKMKQDLGRLLRASSIG